MTTEVTQQTSPDQAQPPAPVLPGFTATPEVTETTNQSAQTPPPNAENDESAKRVAAGVQKRIDEITRQKYEAERKYEAEAQHWRQVAYQQYQEAEAAKRAREEREIATSEPTLDSVGGDVPKFIAEYTKWQVKQSEIALKRAQEADMQRLGQMNAQQAEQMRVAQEQAQRAAQENAIIASKIEEGKKIYPDFDKVVLNPELPPLRKLQPGAFAAIMNSPKGHDIAYAIAKDPLLATEIATAHPLAAVMMVGRLEGQLTAGKKTTSAPPPPATVGSGASHQKTLESMSMEEFMAARARRA